MNLVLFLPHILSKALPLGGRIQSRLQFLRHARGIAYRSESIVQVPIDACPYIRMLSIASSSTILIETGHLLDFCQSTGIRSRPLWVQSRPGIHATGEIL